MSTEYRTRESMSFRQRWNGSAWPCGFGAVALIDTVKCRPAVDLLALGKDQS